MSRKNRAPRVSLDTSEAAKYRDYGWRWRAGESIPELAAIARVSNKEMIERIALSFRVKRFSADMRRWRRECNQNRRRAGKLPPLTVAERAPYPPQVKDTPGSCGIA